MKHSQALVYSTLLAPITAATTARTANLDTQGADYATIVVQIGAEANTNSTNVVLSLLESDDTTATNFATYDTSIDSETVDNTAATNAVIHIDLRGRKRYQQIKITPDTTTNGAVLSSCTGILEKEVKASANTNNAANVFVIS